MSAPTQPFARGYGIFLGIIILWAVSLGLFWALRGLLGMLVSGEPEA